MDEQPMAYVEANGFRFGYLDSGGDGTPVVFMHASAGNSRCWEHQVPAFEARGLRCVRFDLRGRGASRGEGELDGTMAEDLEAIADALDLGRFHLVAHAFGAFSAFDVVLSEPDRIRTLVISHSQAVIGAPQYEDVRHRLVRVQPDMSVEQRELGDSYRARDPEGMARWLAMEALNRPEPSGRQDQRRHLSLDDLERVSVPTLFIAGDEDLYAPPELVRMMAERVPGAELVVLQAGHSGYWERPEEWNSAVLDFITANASS